jgi:hypothetical protein
VLFEIWTRVEPWNEIVEQGIQFSAKLEEVVTAGKRPQAPSDCGPAPRAYITLMTECWADSPGDRPPFWICLERLNATRGSLGDMLMQGDGINSDAQESKM